ncbi:DUF4097 family beta strand repeat-containing protein [Listeria seeligeri]|uniref:DUF4097 family beta strand repeat-containing protein n=1 Tax=Listeria seeligeri TaxID=1640 RepID=UPI00162913FF|nr:DUF4097 family beta strand repeat-containing protein [Listeria seeligeri]MBC1539334.1 DUF4097 family beta strand repeat protein [Listeria seeligeri]MBC1556355.1 DUF4097 family beta strand repeat protein [Listeria seeligeri]MBC6123826.1 DUF4097 family beta strand repeat protein [Listeria seeligeri]MBF2454552.1 DUF4097 family beta strand repeat protein [Listeria seeligeri]MBF2670344.1 DUF4097 family beta strand repeat protein [Listeria seeligeri]
MDKKLRRSRVDRKVGGVFGGLAEFLGIDATLLRLIYIVITIITMKTGIAIIAYIIALFVIPSADTSTEEVLEQRRRRVDEKMRRHTGHNEVRQEVRQAMREKHRHVSKNRNNHPHNHPRRKEERPRPVREFNFDNVTFRSFTIRVATGDVIIRSWDKDQMKIRAVLAVHEKARSIRQLSEEKIWDYFFSQTMLDISPDSFTFESKNELLKTDLVITIPKRLYEQVKIQLLNGNLKYDDTAAEDAIIKTRHGDIRSSGASGKFLSTESADGEIFFKRSTVENVDMSTAKGDIALQGNFLTTIAKAAQGDVEYILENETSSAADLEALNGDIRIQIPPTWNVDGTLGTKKEKIYFDLKNAKIWDDAERNFVFTQNAEEISMATLQAKVGNGIIKVSELENKSV